MSETKLMDDSPYNSNEEWDVNTKVKRSWSHIQKKEKKAYLFVSLIKSLLLASNSESELSGLKSLEDSEKQCIKYIDSER